jgi:uncharacterized protein (DUF1810 family)
MPTNPVLEVLIEKSNNQQTMNQNNLERFISAQQTTYDTALAEIKNGRKAGHWMWFIFPQIQGLGTTETSKHYAITDIGEAMEFLSHPVLGIRLVNICRALLQLPSNNPQEIFGSPDYLKLQSSMTLFDAVPATFPVFGQVLDKFYGGKRDFRTLDILTNVLK